MKKIIDHVVKLPDGCETSFQLRVGFDAHRGRDVKRRVLRKIRRSQSDQLAETHEAWAVSLPCKVIRFNGEEELNENVKRIVNEYYEETNNKQISVCRVIQPTFMFKMGHRN